MFKKIFFSHFSNKTLVVLDPGLDGMTAGHNWSLWHELKQISVEQNFSLITYGLKRPDIHVNPDVIPFFETATYLHEEQIQLWLDMPSKIYEEYKKIFIPDGAHVLLHTASPWHLAWVTYLLKKHGNFTVSVGFLFPDTTWTQNQEILRAIDIHVKECLSILKNANVFMYTETGVYRYHSNECTLPVLLQPISEKTQKVVKGLRAKTNEASEKIIKFGFFGQPRPEKGFEIILQAITSHKVSLNREFYIFLPDFCNELVEKINDIEHAYAINFNSNNVEYLRDMASIDVVLCLYDPSIYTNQMSGIVAEALLLGKPVIVTSGTSLERFVNFVAPGAAISTEYSLDGLMQAVEYNDEIFISAARKAKNAYPIISELKSSERYFKSVFIM